MRRKSQWIRCILVWRIVTIDKTQRQLKRWNLLSDAFERYSYSSGIKIYLPLFHFETKEKNKSNQVRNNNLWQGQTLYCQMEIMEMWKLRENPIFTYSISIRHASTIIHCNLTVERCETNEFIYGCKWSVRDHNNRCYKMLNWPPSHKTRQSKIYKRRLGKIEIDCAQLLIQYSVRI